MSALPDPKSVWLSDILSGLETRFGLLFSLSALIAGDISSGDADTLSSHAAAEGILVGEIESYRKAYDGIFADFIPLDPVLNERIQSVRRMASEAAVLSVRNREALHASLMNLSREIDALPIPRRDAGSLYRTEKPAYIDITT